MNSSATALSASALALALIVGCTAASDNGSSGTGGSSAKGGNGGGNAGGSGGSSPSTGGSPGSGGNVSTGGVGPGSSGGTSGSGGSGAGGAPAGGSGGNRGGSGGSADGPAGETPPAAGSGCVGVTAKFCDDWEKGEVGKPPVGEFTISASGGATVTVDSAQKFSGTKSLHYKTGGAKVMLTFTKQFPINDQHGRLMIRMPKKPVTQNHWDIVQSRGGNNAHWELGGMYGNFELVVDPPDNGIDSKTPFPEGEAWHCIQWNFKNPGDTFSAKLDGQLVNPSPVVGRWKSSMWTNLTVGWEIFGNGAAEFWIDDLAFGEQEIPCPTP